MPALTRVACEEVERLDSTQLVGLLRTLLLSEARMHCYAWTVEFNDATNEGKSTKILLDHILFSPNCLVGGKICFVPESGRIEHEVFSKHVKGKGNNRDDRPSDHIPLSARFELR